MFLCASSQIQTSKR
jgi:hypothetical protein